jgi:hypothetical protein
MADVPESEAFVSSWQRLGERLNAFRPRPSLISLVFQRYQSLADRTAHSHSDGAVPALGRQLARPLVGPRGAP